MDIKLTDEEIWGKTWVCVMNNDMAGVINLMQAGETLSDGAIHSAILNHREIFEAMLKYGLSPNARIEDDNLTKKSYTLLEYAVENGLAESVSILVKHGVDVSNIHNVFPPVVECIITLKGAYAQTKYGPSQRHYYMIKLLIEAGAKINTSDEFQY